MSRHNVKIKTLSAVHMGSGNKKVRDIDFFDNKDFVYFLNVDKIGDALGIASNPSIANDWANKTMLGQQLQFLSKRGVDYKEFSRRVPNYVEEFSDKAPSVSMQMRDGRGIAYIPGSTIKGAIRTAIFALLAKDERREYINNQREAEQWGKNFFGEIAADPFRFLKIGDSFFDNPSMGVINTVQIKKSNINYNRADIDTIKQYAEVFLAENESNFSLTLDTGGLEMAYKSKRISRQVPQFKSVEDLFNAINTHTKHLVKSELDLWDGVIDAEPMCDFLNYIVEEIDDCSHKECVMRMGNASGKRFITGGILENFRFVRNAIPKTRRIELAEDNKGVYFDLLGFVKLTIVG